ncbi:MAG TPA: glycosyltransferase family 4 protein [Anaerolineales bacterium]|nr:glycosyltransferase family 4 protein [Anaerolineales bacterium]
MNPVLLTVSGLIPSDLETQIAQGKRPLTDYIALARAFEADLLDYDRARTVGGWVGQLLEKTLGRDFMLGWACFVSRKKYQVIFTDGEQVGIPLAFFSKYLGWGKRPKHLMIVHILSVKKKMIFFDWFGIQSHIDKFLCYATRQEKFIEERWGVPDDRAVFTPFMVDADFFSLQKAIPSSPPSDSLADLLQIQKPILCAVGLEFRDYPTLLEAVRGLDVHVVVAAGSPWSKRSDSTEGQEIPANVTVRRFSQFDLRQVYAMSRFMVMPLLQNDFQAGITALLEAMSMERAIICSQTRGQTDVIRDGFNGLYVPPGDPASLRAAIERLLAHPEQAEQMGKNGRHLIESEMSLDHYVQRLNGYVQEAKNAKI